MKKSKVLIMITLVILLITSSCSPGSGSGTISVNTREEGSGTRSAFVELFEVHDEDKNDGITDFAEQTNNTAVMMTSVQNDKNAIGYISMGSMNDSVKALKIDGIEATADNVSNGSYAISRPLNLVTTDSLTQSAEDFLLFILSSEGQEAAASKGYIKNEDSSAYRIGETPAEKILVSGSSSVSPVMEFLKEAYLEIYPAAIIEIQTSDSSTGINDVINGISHIGMVSRELKPSEEESGLIAVRIAIDGISVIVNNDNEIESLTKAQVKGIYMGEITKWSDL